MPVLSSPVNSDIGVNPVSVPCCIASPSLTSPVCCVWLPLGPSGGWARTRGRARACPGHAMHSTSLHTIYRGLSWLALAAGATHGIAAPVTVQATVHRQVRTKPSANDQESIEASHQCPERVVGISRILAERGMLTLSATAHENRHAKAPLPPGISSIRRTLLGLYCIVFCGFCLAWKTI
jgi:hypothetical protein